MPRPHVVRTKEQAAAVPRHLPIQVEFTTRSLTIEIDDEIYRSGNLFAITAAVRDAVIRQLMAKKRSPGN